MFFVGGIAAGALDFLSGLQPQHSKNSAAVDTLRLGKPFNPATPTDPTTTTTAQNASSPPVAGARNAGNPLTANVLGYLIQAQAEHSSDPAGAGTPPLSPGQSKLFSKLDSDGDGKISKSEFDAAFPANPNSGATDRLFSKLDKNGDNTIDQGEFRSAVSRGHGHGHHYGAGGVDQSADEGSLASLLKDEASKAGTSRTVVNNPDGSTTTSISYADGAKISFQTAPSKISSN
jgi:hypothetical protein